MLALGMGHRKDKTPLFLSMNGSFCFFLEKVTGYWTLRDLCSCFYFGYTFLVAREPSRDLFRRSLMHVLDERSLNGPLCVCAIEL